MSSQPEATTIPAAPAETELAAVPTDNDVNADEIGGGEEDAAKPGTPPPSVLEGGENNEGRYYPSWVKITPSKKKDDRPRTPNSIMRTPNPPIRPSPSIVNVQRPQPAVYDSLLNDAEIQESRGRHRALLEEQRDRTKILCDMLNDENEKNSNDNVQEAEESMREAISRAETRDWFMLLREAHGSHEVAEERAKTRVLGLSTELQLAEEEARPAIPALEEKSVAEILRWEKVHRPWSFNPKPLVPSAPKANNGGNNAMVVANPSPPDAGLSFAFRGRQKWAQEKADNYENKKYRNRKQQMHDDQMEARGAVECEELKEFMGIQQKEIVDHSYAKRLQQTREHEETHGTDLASGNPTPETIARRRHAAAKKIQRVGRRYNAKAEVGRRQTVADAAVRKEAREEDAVLLIQRCIRSSLSRCRRTHKSDAVEKLRDSDAAYEDLVEKTIITQQFANAHISEVVVAESAEVARKKEEEREVMEQARVAWEMHLETLSKLGLVTEIAKKMKEAELPHLDLLLQVQEENPAPATEETNAANGEDEAVIEPKAPYRAIEWLSKALLLSAGAPSSAKPKEEEENTTTTTAGEEPAIEPIGNCGFSLLSLIRSATISADVPLPDACRVLIRSHVPVPEHQVSMMLEASSSPEKVAAEKAGRDSIRPSDTQYAALEALLAQNRGDNNQDESAQYVDDGVPFSAEYVKETIWQFSEKHHNGVGTFVELNPNRTKMYEDKTEFEEEEILEMNNHEMLNREKLIEEQVEIFLDEIAADFKSRKAPIAKRDQERKKHEEDMAALEADDEEEL